MSPFPLRKEKEGPGGKKKLKKLKKGPLKRRSKIFLKFGVKNF
jgi:hypothetical protein